MTVHRSALVDPGASVAEDAEIGPFCVVGAGARIGPGCRLGPRVSIYGPVVAGRGNLIQAGVTIGKPDGGRIEIGDGNVFREFSHIDAAAGATTRIGSRNRIGTWASVNSGGTLANDVRLGAYSVVGENVLVEDGAWIQPQVCIDPNGRVGKGCLIRIQMTVFGDVPPYMCFDGNPAAIQSVNPNRRTDPLDRAFDVVYKSGLSLAEAARKLLETPSPSPEVAELAEFLKSAKPPEPAFE
jgi:UDP-N-acetylglucosamine acyltransferase